MYHYTDSGLDNVYLVNGYNEIDTPYGRAVSVEEIDGLHRAIADWLLNLPKPLNGKEFRFLRHELDLSQKKLGRLMGKSELTIARWEKRTSRAVDPVADRLIRIIYAEFDGNGEVRELIEKLADLDQLKQAECRLEERNGMWRVAEPVAA